jgi:hypothetical protein
MANLKEILVEIKNKHEVIVNPFDDVTYGNFWFEKQATENVESIHKDAIKTIESQLKLLKQGPTHLSKSTLILGDMGCGKSHLLGRLKKQLNNQAFFVYIQPIEESSYFWRHTLQYTIASLMQKPQGQSDSQLRLWLKGFPVFQNPDWFKGILGEKRAFIRDLKNTYPSGIYEAKKFFSVLYELATNNYQLACEWLAGEDLDEEDLSTLGVNKSIDNEKSARGILNNFGRIANATKPIVLCFDQIERAFSGVFNFNTTLHNERLVNFLIIISAVRANWQEYKRSMIQSDLARINKTVSLDDITIDEAEKLWINRLKPLHLQCNPQPEFPIAPLDKSKLEENAPGHRINLREALNLGGKLFQEYIDAIDGLVIPPPPPPKGFVRIWKNTFTEMQEKVNSLVQFSDQEFMEMLKYVFMAVQVENVNPRFLPGVNATRSFNYQCPATGITRGIVWNNCRNNNAFCALMRACERVLINHQCQSLLLIRNIQVSPQGTIGYDIYQSIFRPASTQYIHYHPTIEDLQYLKTYHKLAKDAISGDLVINFERVSLPKLKELTREYQVLNNCIMLQKLKIVKPSPELPVLKENIVNIVEQKSPINITDLHSEIENIFSNRFIPKYYFLKVNKELDKKIPDITISNPHEKPDNFIIEYKNL